LHSRAWRSPSAPIWYERRLRLEFPLLWA